MVPVLLGLRNGLLRSIFSLIGIIAGLFLATRYNDNLTSLFGFLKLEPKLLSLISFIAIIIFCYFICVFIAGRISRINAVTRTFDRILGVILGICKGLIIASLFLILTTNTFSLFEKTTIDRSKFYTSVINVAPDVYNYIQRFFPNAKDFYEELNNLILQSKK